MVASRFRDNVKVHNTIVAHGCCPLPARLCGSGHHLVERRCDVLGDCLGVDSSNPVRCVFASRSQLWHTAAIPVAQVDRQLQLHGQPLAENAVENIRAVAHDPDLDPAVKIVMIMRIVVDLTDQLRNIINSVRAQIRAGADRCRRCSLMSLWRPRGDCTNASEAVSVYGGGRFRFQGLSRKLAEIHKSWDKSCPQIA
jgi:hypothetical protein